MKPFVEYEVQEFNPFYYTQTRISKWFTDKARSNEWNLRLKFESYFNEFEDSIFGISKKVKELEKDLLLQKEVEERIGGSGSNTNKDDIIATAKKMITKSFKEKFISQTDKDDAKMKEKMEEKNKKPDRKADVAAYKVRYQKSLINQMARTIINERDRVKLSDPERVAAENLAKALSAYNEQDPRVLRFTDFELRKDGKKQDRLPSLTKLKNR